MRLVMKKLIFLILFLPSISFANLNLITWKGTYYHATPINKLTSLDYCTEHTPGSFIHTIQDKSVVTDKDIKLDQPTFHIDKVGKVFLIYGDITATGETNDKQQWHDRLHYYAYKFTEAGVTKGIWYSDKCKGLYRGIVVKNENTSAY